MQSQVLYVVHITSILGGLALVPVGATGTILFSMRKETGDFPGASCDSKKDAGESVETAINGGTSTVVP